MPLRRWRRANAKRASHIDPTTVILRYRAEGAPTAERTMDPARMFMESLTSGIRSHFAVLHYGPRVVAYGRPAHGRARCDVVALQPVKPPKTQHGSTTKPPAQQSSELQ
jgi:hypothetical protein